MTYSIIMPFYTFTLHSLTYYSFLFLTEAYIGFKKGTCLTYPNAYDILYYH